MTAPPDIFLSYNREDQVRAKLFADAFATQGFTVWWDVGLRAGDAYDEVTENALRTAKAVVVLWSKKSVQSRWVRAEATLADRNKTLVPCMIAACERPIMFELTQTAELAHWQGDPADRAWLAFLGDVNRFIANAAAPAVPVPSSPLAAPTIEETLKPGQSGTAPSLAVLPFTNRSNLLEDEVFAEGMVEDVISALSQGVNVRVLGASATAALSRAAITDLPGVGRRLGVRYLLEGNVRRVGANLRVATQLLEAATGEVVWSAKFDRPLAELAELQEELATDLAASLDTQVYSLEMEHALKKPSDLTAWEATARAMSAYRQSDPASLLRAAHEAARAVSIAPDYGPALALCACSHAVIYMMTSPDDAAEVSRIRALAERAISLAPEDVSVLTWAGITFSYLGMPEIALRHLERAMRKAPGHGLTHFQLSFVYNSLNQPEKALAHVKLAERLMPGSQMMHANKSLESNALIALGRWQEGEAATDESIALNPAFGIHYVTKALYCVRLGREAEAPEHVETARRLGVDLTSAERIYRRTTPIRPTLEADLITIRTLYGATEAGQ